MDLIFILYVADQQKSRDFYQQILNRPPILDVPGMTEFNLNHHSRLGLMPETGIPRLLEGKTPAPSLGQGIPRCELYLFTEDLATDYLRLQRSGALELSGIQDRDWGDKACYFADPDGHIIALAEKGNTGTI